MSLLLIAGPVILAMWVVPYSASVFIEMDKELIRKIEGTEGTFF